MGYNIKKIFTLSALILFLVLGGSVVVKKVKEHFIKAEIKKQLFKIPNSKPAIPKVETPKNSPLPRSTSLLIDNSLPDIDRLYQLFVPGPKQFPIVETITYQSQVPWVKGRLAWIEDYSMHYATPLHFIIHSLHGNNYENHKVMAGSRFNVLKKNKKIEFLLVADLTMCKMGFYYVDLDSSERVLLKTYAIAVGKETSEKSSLTPVGQFSLGSKVALYKPGIKGFFQDKQVDMVEVFGTRWIPFIDAKGNSTGLGLQGVGWEVDKESGIWREKSGYVGKASTEGCIWMHQEDIEALFAIIAGGRPARIEIVSHFKDAKLPGVEVAVPMG